ncbi:MAG: type II toxin-antitoxin system HigB family toxin [Thermodesulfovibrionales bacterium]|nr:type II toxin-antitoxin system HigB family toxin [Thermodesulfovibrionales bacterium]
MVLLGREKLEQFTQKHTNARNWIQTWLAEVENVKWQGPQDIKKRYAKASFLADNVVIFDVKGSAYRLEVQVAYNTGKVIVKWAGTHAEYDKRHK